MNLVKLKKQKQRLNVKNLQALVGFVAEAVLIVAAGKADG